MRISAKNVLMATLEGATVTHSHVKADPESPKTTNTVIEFQETPQEMAEVIKNNPEIQNRLLGDQ